MQRDREDEQDGCGDASVVAVSEKDFARVGSVLAFPSRQEVVGMEDDGIAPVQKEGTRHQPDHDRVDPVDGNNDCSHYVPVTATPGDGDHRLRDESSHYERSEDICGVVGRLRERDSREDETRETRRQHHTGGEAEQNI